MENQTASSNSRYYTLLVITISAVCFWLPMIVCILRAISGNHVGAYIPFIFLITPVLIVYVLLEKGVFICILSVIYVVLFPIIATCIVFIGVMTYWKSAWKVMSVSTHMFVGLSLLVIDFIIVLAILFTHDQNRHFHLTVVHFVVLTGFLLVAIRWACDPLKPVLTTFNIIKTVITKLIESERNEIQSLKKRKNPSLDGAFSGTARMLEGVTSKLFKDKAAKGYLLITMIAAFATLISYVVFSYAVIYYAAVSQSKDSFSGLNEGFSESLLYSISVITTTPLSDVIPKTECARYTFVFELIHAVMLITIFLSIFSASLGVNTKDRAVDIIRSSDATVKCVSDFIDYAKEAEEKNTPKLVSDNLGSTTAPSDSEPKDGTASDTITTRPLDGAESS